MGRERIESIDTVRGVALLGILVMNIIGMAYAGAAYINPMLTGGADATNIALWAAAFVAADGKMRALFSMLFGASMLLMAETGPEEAATGRHVARMLVLLLFGMVHGSLLWPGDILLPFAVAGLLVWPFRRLDSGQFFLGGVLLTALQLSLTLGSAWQAEALRAAALPGAGAESLAAWRNLEALLWPDAASIAGETAQMTGSLADILAVRHRAVLFSRLYLLPFRILPETAGLMFVGMGLYRLHWWRGDFAAGHYRRLALLLVPAGLAAGAFSCWRFAASGYSVVGFFYADSARLLIAPPLAVGYAAFFILLAKRQRLPRLVGRLAACGRMALSNYVGASVLGTLVFTGVGFGLFGQLSRPQVLGVVGAIWILQLFWSRFWLERYRYGPLEWLWRSMARARMQPWRPPAYRRQRAKTGLPAER